MARKKWDDPVHYYWNLIRKAIYYCEDVAEHQRRYAELFMRSSDCQGEADACTRSAKRFSAMAEWLRELKELRAEKDEPQTDNSNKVQQELQQDEPQTKEPTWEQVKEYCNKRCLDIVDSGFVQWLYNCKDKPQTIGELKQERDSLGRTVAEKMTALADKIESELQAEDAEMMASHLQNAYCRQCNRRGATNDCVRESLQSVP